jgi:hydroxymethylbilane synthase
MIIGTRGSRLAVTQANIVQHGLNQLFPEMEIDIKMIATTGDKVRDRPLKTLGGFGAFVKELDQKIVMGEIDASVNSLKDMPVVPTEGTKIVSVLARGPVEDVLISEHKLKDLPQGSIIGTSSVRRRAILLNLRPDLEVRDLRGNVPTRLNRLREGKFDGILLARAGLERLELNCKHQVLDPTQFVPAVGQGAIAISCATRSSHSEILAQLNHVETRLCVEAERYILAGLGGGCSVPIGIWAEKEFNSLRVRGIVLREDGKDAFRLDRSMNIEEPISGLNDYIRTMKEGWEAMI